MARAAARTLARATAPAPGAAGLLAGAQGVRRRRRARHATLPGILQAQRSGHHHLGTVVEIPGKTGPWTLSVARARPPRPQASPAGPDAAGESQRTFPGRQVDRLGPGSRVLLVGLTHNNEGPMIPIIKPVMDEREAEAARRVIL